MPLEQFFRQPSKQFFFMFCTMPPPQMINGRSLYVLLQKINENARALTHLLHCAHLHHVHTYSVLAEQA